MKQLGIIGGLGPETSCKFCLNVNNKFRRINNCQPDIFLENLPISAKAEKNIICGNLGQEHLILMEKSVERLNKLNVDFIAIPCNTVHVFINKLRNISKKPILSIIEECAKECEKRGLKTVGLLGSTKTIKEKLHLNELKKFGITTTSPLDKDQKKINKIIIKIIHNKTDNKDKSFLLRIINELKIKGAEAVILACTDLPLLISQKESKVHLINTLEVLENSVVKLLSNKSKLIQ